MQINVITIMHTVNVFFGCHGFSKNSLEYTCIIFGLVLSLRDAVCSCVQLRTIFPIPWDLLTNVLYDGQCRAWWSHFFNIVCCCNFTAAKSREVSTVLLESGQRAISQKPNEACKKKTLRLALEYVKDYRFGLSLVALGCSAGQILVQ